MRKKGGLNGVVGIGGGRGRIGGEREKEKAKGSNWLFLGLIRDIPNKNWIKNQTLNGGKTIEGSWGEGYRRQKFDGARYKLAITHFYNTIRKEMVMRTAVLAHADQIC